MVVGGLGVLLYLVFEVFLPGGFLGVVLVIVLGELDGSCTATAGSEPAGVRAPLCTAIVVCHTRLKSLFFLLGTAMLCVGNYQWASARFHGKPFETEHQLRK